MFSSHRSQIWLQRQTLKARSGDLSIGVIWAPLSLPPLFYSTEIKRLSHLPSALIDSVS